MEIDKIDYHWDNINDDVSEEEQCEKAGAHIGYYIEWAYKKGLAPNSVEKNEVAEYKRVVNSEMNGLKFLMENCDGKFWDSDLSDEGQRFTFYVYDTYVNNLETILGHKPYTEMYNEKDLKSVSKYLDKVYEIYLINSSDDQIKGESHKETNGKELIMKDKIKVGEILALIVPLIISVSGFSVFFDPSEEKNIGVLLVGILFGLIFAVLFPNVTFKRPYSKVNFKGIYYRNLYGKEIFIPWNRIDAIICMDKVLLINDKKIEERELNAYTLSTIERFRGWTSDDYDDEAEWIENGIHIVTKNAKNYFPEVYTINSNLDVEYTKKIWSDNVK